MDRIKLNTEDCGSLLFIMAGNITSGRRSTSDIVIVVMANIPGAFDSGAVKVSNFNPFNPTTSLDMENITNALTPIIAPIISPLKKDGRINNLSNTKITLLLLTIA